MKSSNPMWKGASGKLGTYVVYELNGQTVMRVRTPAPTGFTMKQVNCRTAYANCAVEWGRLSEPVKLEWGRLALRLPRWEAEKANTPLTGFNAFCQSVTGRQALSLPMLTDCPPLDIPPFLPDVRVTAQMTGTALSLSLGGAEYGAAVQVFGAKPVADYAPSPTRFSLLGLLPNGIGSGGEDIGAWYKQQFPKVCAGCVVTLKLVPVSASGFRGQPLVIPATVG